MENALGEYQTILLLGGRSDIGRAIVARVASAYTRSVILAGRSLSEADVASFRSELASRNLESIEVVTREFDASRPDRHVEFFDSLGLDSIDMAIFSFGVLGEQDLLANDPIEAAQLMTTNTTGVVSSGLACAKMMAAQGRGQMLFVSSVAGVRVRKSNFVYGSSKAGMDAFALGLSDSLEGLGPKVAVLRPGFVKSSMTTGLKPAPFALTPDQVARLTVEGLRKGGKVIWAPGALRFVFGIFRILPGAIWRRLPIN